MEILEWMDGWFFLLPFIGIEGCAVPTFYICDPAGCRVTYAHPVCGVSRGGQQSKTAVSPQYANIVGDGQDAAA